MHLLAAYDGEYIPIQADLSTLDGYKKLAKIFFLLIPLSIIVGLVIMVYLLIQIKDNLEEMTIVHLTSPLLLTKELLPKMIRQQHGNILLITSIWGQTGAACEVVYSTVKGAQIAFVKSLSKEMALNGIRVNGIAPGAVKPLCFHNLVNRSSKS